MALLLYVFLSYDIYLHELNNSYKSFSEISASRYIDFPRIAFSFYPKVGAIFYSSAAIFLLCIYRITDNIFYILFLIISLYE
jgi:hypothetical protein